MSRTLRLGSDVGVRIKLSEELLGRQQIECKHERLIAVVSRPEIAFAKGVG